MVTKRQKDKKAMVGLAGGKGKADTTASGPVVRVGVYMTPDLHKRAKLAAVHNGETLTELVCRAVEAELAGGA